MDSLSCDPDDDRGVVRSKAAGLDGNVRYDGKVLGQ